MWLLDQWGGDKTAPETRCASTKHKTRTPLDSKKNHPAETKQQCPGSSVVRATTEVPSLLDAPDTNNSASKQAAAQPA